MTGIQINVDIDHPPERVWRAITEPRLLRQWFAETDLHAEAGTRFRWAALPGLFSGGDGDDGRSSESSDIPAYADAIDGEVVEAVPGQRLVLRLGSERQSRLEWELTAIPIGCRLTLRQTWREDADDRRKIAAQRAAYKLALARPVTATLDWLALADVRAAERQAARPAPVWATATTATFPAIPRHKVPPSEATALIQRYRVPMLAGAAAMGVSVTMLLVVSMLVRESAPTFPASARGALTATADTATPSGTRPARGYRGSPSPQGGGPGSTVSPSAAGAARVNGLIGRYRTVQNWAIGYRAEIRLRNAGRFRVERWVVTVSLPSPATLTEATGAAFAQDGDTVAFTPLPGGGALGPGAVMTLSFDVSLNGALAAPRQPRSCRVGGRPCEGLEA